MGNNATAWARNNSVANVCQSVSMFVSCCAMGDDSFDVDWLESPAPPVRVVARVAAVSDIHVGSDAIVPHAAPRKKVFKHWSRRTNEEQEAWTQTMLRLREKGRSRKKEAAYKEGIGEVIEKSLYGSVVSKWFGTLGVLPRQRLGCTS